MSQFDFSFRRWLLFYLYCAFIYLSLPVAPTLWEKITAIFGKSAENFPFIILILSGAIIIFKFYLLKKQNTALGIFIICIVFSILFVISKNLQYQVERIHLIEYAILSVIIYRSIKKEQPIEVLYVKILLIGFIVGIIDEGIQYLLPNRVFDARDILLNGAGVLLGEVLVYNIKDMP